MWCKQCQQDVRAITLPSEMGRSPHCPRCGDLLRLAAPRTQAMLEMADATGEVIFAPRSAPVSVVSRVAGGDFGGESSITITAPRRRRRAEISIDWQWDEDRRALRRIHAALEGGAMYRFDRPHLETALAGTSGDEKPCDDACEAPDLGSSLAGGLLFVGLASLSAGAAVFVQGLLNSASATSNVSLPLLIGGQTLILFSLLCQLDCLPRKSSSI